MDTRALRNFIVAAEEQHFRRAAERLHISQPALSRWIAMLEKEVGAKLFERVGRRVQLSHAGKVMLTESTRILRELDHANEFVRMVDRGQMGTLRLAFAEIGAGNGMVLDAVRAFRVAEPNVQLSLLRMNSDTQAEALQENRIDAGFLYRFAGQSSTYQSRLLSLESVRVVVPKRHPLARRKSVRLADLGDAPLLCVDRSANPLLHEKLMRLLSRAGLLAQVAQYATDSEVIEGLAAVGMGLGIVSSAVCWRQHPDVDVVRLDERDLSYRFEFAYTQAPLSPALKRFIDILSTVRPRGRARARPTKR
jgi:DNA-binding transcriptional LysR family regulator